MNVGNNLQHSYSGNSNTRNPTTTNITSPQGTTTTTSTNPQPTPAGTTSSSPQPKTLKAAFTELTDRFFKCEDARWSDYCKKKFGLEQPLWVWTHRAMTTASVNVTSPASPLSGISPASPSSAAISSFENLTTLEATRIGNLVHWLVSNAHLKGEEIAVVCTTSQKKLLAEGKHKVGKSELATSSVDSKKTASAALPTSSSSVVLSATRAESSSVLDEAEHFALQKSLVTVLDHQEALALFYGNNKNNNKDTVVVTQQQQQQAETSPSTTMNETKHLPSKSNTNTQQRKKYSIVIHAIGVPLNPTYLEFMNNAGATAVQQSAEMCEDAFVMICDAAWMYAPIIRSKCPQWSALVSDVLHAQFPKIRMPKDFVKTLPSPALASTPGLIAAKIPICCPQHPQQRSLADGNSVFEGFCNAKCLKPYSCRENEAKIAAFLAAQPKAPSSAAASIQQHHLHQQNILSNAKLLHCCQNRCHLSTSLSSHKACPYPCTSVIHPCGESCKMGCADGECTCGHDVEVPLDCYHDVIVGFDSERFQPITERVFHVFRGACGDAAKAKQQCTVNVPTICAVCSGDFVAPCHALVAVGHQLTDGSRTAICDGCVRRQREIRSQVRNELIREIDAKRKKAQQDLKMQQYLEKIGKGAGTVRQLSFDVGQRVAIVDMEARRQPFEFDHPECTFVYFHDEEQYFAKVQGGHGVVVKSVVDGSEQQYIILLASGQHVLFASNGLKAVKAIGNFEMTGASLTHTYLLTVGPEKFQQQQQEHQHQDSGSFNCNPAAPTTSPFTALVRPQFGKSAIVIKPITVKPPREFMITPLNEMNSSENDDTTKKSDHHHDSYTTPDDSCASKGEILMSNIVGTIVGEDVSASLANGQPMVKFHVEIKFVEPEIDGDEDDDEQQSKKDNGTEADDEKEPAAKRCRSEANGAICEEAANDKSATTPVKPTTTRRRREKTVTMVLSAPFLHLEVISLCEARITNSEKQIVGPEAHALFTELAAESYAKFKKQRAPLPRVSIRDAPATKAEMFSVVGIVNYPIVRKGLQPFNIEVDVDEESGGLFTTKSPCVVLESRLKQAMPTVTATTTMANASNGGSGGGAGNSASSDSVTDRAAATVAKLQQQIAQLKSMGCQHPFLIQGLEKQLAVALAAVAASSSSNNNNDTAGQPSQTAHAVGATPLVVIPLLFVDVDEEAAAERQLEATEFARLELLFEERYKKISEDLSFANEEKRALEEEKMATLAPYPKSMASTHLNGASLGGGSSAEVDDNANIDENPEDTHMLAMTNYVVTPTVLQKNNGMAPVALSVESALAAATAALKIGPSAATPTPMHVVDWKAEEEKQRAALLQQHQQNNTPSRGGAAPSAAVEGDVFSLFAAPFLSNAAGSHEIVGHVKASLLTDQQRLNKVWAFCYSIPKPVVTPQGLLDLQSRREKMPKTPSLVMLEVERKRQALASKQPSVKNIEEWAKALDSVAEDQKGDHQYGLAINNLVEEELQKKR